MQKIHNLLISMLLLLITLPAAGFECVAVEGVEDDSISYRLREDNFCEGFYRSNLGTPGLEVVSLLNSPLDYDLERDMLLRISAPQIKAQAVRVSVVGIPLKLYYRLDAEIAPGGSLHWPLDILVQEKIQARNLGLVGRLSDAESILVPLSVNSVDQAVAVQPAQLSLRSSVDVDKVQWRYAEVDSDNCGNWSDWQAVQPKYGKVFRSGRPISLTLPSLPSAQLCVEVAAQPSTGEWLKQLLRIQVG